MSFGFIFTRCVKIKEHNIVWKQCYESIRKFYKEPIIIINDNCIKELIENIDFENTTIFDSEFNGSAEILPYYYFYKLKPFEKAIILQDSMFFQKRFDFQNYNLKDVLFLWEFTKFRNHFIEYEKFLIHQTQSEELVNLYESNIWKGSLGGTSFITYNFVELLQENYNFLRWIPYLSKGREYRHSFERVFAVMCWYLSDSIKIYTSINGDLHIDQTAILSNIKEYENYKTESYMVKIMCNR